MKPSLSEADVARTVEAALRTHGWKFVHMRAAQTGRVDGRGRTIYTTPYTGDDGFPDYMCVHPLRARILVMEIKGSRKPSTVAEKNRLALQQAWLDDFMRAGVVALLVTPENLDAALEEIGR